MHAFLPIYWEANGSRDSFMDKNWSIFVIRLSFMGHPVFGKENQIFLKKLKIDKSTKLIDKSIKLIDKSKNQMINRFGGLN
jgi:hypothetical protein